MSCNNLIISYQQERYFEFFWISRNKQIALTNSEASKLTFTFNNFDNL